MASNPPKHPEAKYFDLPGVGETFADSIRFIGFDGQTWRIELTVTRLRPDIMTRMPSHIEDAQEIYPACRLVLTMPAGIELLNKLTQTAAALEAQGIIKRNEPSPKPYVMQEPETKQ